MYYEVRDITHEGDNEMTDMFEKGFYFGLGAFSVTKEKAEKLISDLVKKGKLSHEEAGKVVKDLLSRAEEEKKVLSEKIDISLEKTIKKFNLATRKDIEDINKRLDEISKKLK